MSEEKGTERKLPKHWPPHVKSLTWAMTSKLGVDEAGQLYWDGEKVMTHVSLSRRDRLLVMIATISAASMAVVDLIRFAMGK